MMNNNFNQPSGWKWKEDKVDPEDEHIRVGYGGYDKPFVPVAMVAPGEEKCFLVEFLVKREELKPSKQKIYDKVVRQLDYFLMELNDPNPWTYAIYHCGSTANAYSDIRWAYFPMGYKD